MAEQLGRDLVLVKGSSGGTGGTAIAGVRVKGLAINNEIVDITSDDSNGWRESLAEPGQKSLEVTVSGVSDDRVMLAAAMSSSDVSDEYMLTWADGADVYGTFMIASYSENGEYNTAVTFEATLQSSGSVTYQAGA
ncbi:phage tail tube protein [Prosthecochloris sp.]|uniref:phage tail tube protein n=1 Tax=Prosthecochloris sp. TaxID=290513 RepID=UPI0025E50A55|nr:phage tail tube protein [Prosthecochloris sp.]